MCVPVNAILIAYIPCVVLQRTHVHTQTHNTHAHTHTHTYKCIQHTHTHTHTHTTRKHKYTCIHIHVCTHVCTYTLCKYYECVHIHMYIHNCSNVSYVPTLHLRKLKVLCYIQYYFYIFSMSVVWFRYAV